MSAKHIPADFADHLRELGATDELMEFVRDREPRFTQLDIYDAQRTGFLTALFLMGLFCFLALATHSWGWW